MRAGSIAIADLQPGDSGERNQTGALSFGFYRLSDQRHTTRVSPAPPRAESISEMCR